jgi:hypothetical protein
MSVGEASYFNYPDAELESMVTDTVNNIIPEVPSLLLIFCILLSPQFSFPLVRSRRLTKRCT